MSQQQYFQEEKPASSTNIPSPSSDSDDLHYWLALLYAPGIGPATFQRILTICAEPGALFKAKPESVLGEDLKLNHKTLGYLRNPDWKRVENDLAWVNKPDCHIFSINDRRYPALLREIADPPPILFVRGNPDVLETPQVAIVGSRNPSAGGRSFARDIARQLAQAGLTITSGLALGIDAAGHEGALEAGLTVAVAGTGLDRIYPSRHRDLAHRIVEKGALVSEFPLGTVPIASNFPRRNRVITGLSLGTLVVEAALQSGSLISARLAADQGRDVFAIPGSVHNPLSRGCHELIRQGAKLVENVTDIMEELGPMAYWAIDAINQKSQNCEEYDRVEISFNPIIENMGFEPISIDTLVERCGLTPESVSSMLLTLELQGRVTSNGGLYSRIDISR